MTTDDLRRYLKSLPEPGKQPARKAEMITATMDRLVANARRTWKQLDELGQKAVAFAMHDEDHRFHEDQFKARYGSVPKFEKVENSWATRDPTRLGLIVIKCRRGRVVPDEIHDVLRSIVPEPETLTIRPVAELLSHVEMATRHSEAAAQQDLLTTLRLIEQGKLAASAKTHHPSAATMKLLQPLLRDGDFYEWIPKKNKWEQEIGPMKAFAWPLLVQAGKLAKVSGSKLTLTKQGRAALTARPADTLKHLWEGWRDNKLFDEFNRVNDIKGQRTRGTLTRPAFRRQVVEGALTECPPGEWVSFDDFSRYMLAKNHQFHVANDPWKLYICDAQYGSLGYDGFHGWNILQGRFLLALLFEYAAPLGMIDVAYEHPDGARKDFRDLWGVDGLARLSRYDGLRYFRLTSLGAYVLGLTDRYEPQSAPSDLSLTVLPNRRVQVSGALDLTAANLLETFAEREDEETWLLSEAKLLSFVEHGGRLKELRDLLATHDDQPLPESVESFLQRTEQRATACRLRGLVHLIECADEKTAESIAGNAATKKLCRRSGDKHLVVAQDKEPAFRQALASLGYGMPYS